MDRRDTMGGPYYTPRGMSGAQSLMHGSTMQHFQSNFGGGGSIGSTLQQESPQNFSSNAAPPSVVPAAPAEPIKRKRGRPRKYGGGGSGADGGVSLGLSPASISPSSGSMGSTQKRGRGRPPGSGRKQQLASSGVWLSGTAGMGFTPHIITVAAGEDVATKILAFSQQGQRAICILSAMGSVSTVTLRQPSSSGGSVTYEGRFEILCLSGSYLQSDASGSRNRSGGLSISLASPDGRVIGGGVGGMLIAAGPVQVIIGSFSWGSSKMKNKKSDNLEGGRISCDNNNNMMSNANSSPLGQSMSSLPIGIWRDSEPSNLPDVHVDIDLMRG